MAFFGMPWDFEPGVIIGCLLLLALYFAALRRASLPRRIAFCAGDAILLFALVSPLDTLADHYLFSAHMVQHLLLLELVPPLLLLGLTAGFVENMLRVIWLKRLERRLRQPLLAWIIGFATLCLWHIPRLYDAAVRSDPIHALEHICFLVSATIFWWPVLSPRAASRMPVPTAIFYLFARMAANAVLGTLVALAPLGFYTAYLHSPGVRAWPGLTPQLDQRLGGLLMWLPALLVDVAAVPLWLIFWNAHTQPDAAPHPDACLPE